MPEFPRCPFEKAILTKIGDCSTAVPRPPSTMVVECSNHAAYAQCHQAYEHLLEKGRFSLGLGDTSARLTNTQAVRLQVGGLLGVAEALDSKTEITDIARLIEHAANTWGNAWKNAHLEPVIRAISQYQPRKRSRHEPNS